MSTPEQPTPVEDVTTVARAFYEPFRTGDTSTYDQVLDEDGVDVPPAPGQQQGPVAAQIARFRAAMPDCTVRHEDVIAAGDKVAVRNTVSGTHQGAFTGHEPTGRRIEMRTTDVHQVRGGRIVTTWHLEDFAGLMAQLSAGPEVPTPQAWA